MDAADTIRQCLADVTRLRAHCAGNPALNQAVAEIKALQARRFAGTYADLMRNPDVAPATRFFLNELYSPHDFSQRDDQFGRIAGTLQTVFPPAVVDTAVALAQLHALTERLDHAAGCAWLAEAGTLHPAARYLRAWRSVGERSGRTQQLTSVLAIGQDLARLTRTPGLRTLLRLMRRPARLAGLATLQSFLETGFDTFGALARQDGAVEGFLRTVQERETQLIALWFDGAPVACETEIARTLGEAR
ncbi:FFLEELY motif protein [Simplicispira psychrophila]|uniref:FFLEELY motif protein n=1 Tax=Simplicispira psychrophila TaxID=80882 RepID=UPI00047FAF6F|nr:hypothetical protein [Simplicispira psychrophila]